VFRELLNLLSPGSGVPTDERRDTIRLHCSINATLKTKKTTRECRVTNASLTGLQLEIESKVRRKTPVTVHRNQHGAPVRGTVMWCRASKSSNRFQIGVAYEDDRNMLKESWIKPALKELGFTVGRINEKRQLTRVPGHHRRCFLKSPEGDTYSSGEVQNLSVGGASVDSEVEMPKGLKLVIKIDGLKDVAEMVCNAEVRSCKYSRQTRKYICGLIFLDSDEKLVRKHMSAMMGAC
jgi:PilZ domain-containing protein